MGIETFWYPDAKDSIDPKRLDDAVVICEDYQTNHLPINSSCTYLVHTLRNVEKYAGCKRLIDLRYNCHYQDNESNYKYHFDRAIATKLGPLCYYQGGATEQLYISWATDLLPSEFDYENIAKEPSTDTVKYSPFVGTIYQGKYSNLAEITKWQSACERNNVLFQHIDPWKSPVSNSENRAIINGAYLAPDIRGQQNIDCGYISCRLFKNISYGQIGLTNSLTSHFAMEELTLYHPCTSELFSIGEKYRVDKFRITEQMKFVAENHTYIQRIKSLKKIL